jgi:TetR/AcrR family transcriptional repressor of nem operon
MVTTQSAEKRGRLIQAAMRLAYRHGFGQTSLADIAEEAEVPLGNVYYYFKTKEEFGKAIIGERLLQAKALQQKLDKMLSPEQRLCAFVQMTVDNREMLARGGCPIGTLCTELHKEGGALAKHSAALFTDLLTWLKAQFSELHEKADAQGLAVHLLSALQGIAVLAHTLRDPNIVVAEARRLQGWIQTVRTHIGKGGGA